VPFNIAHAASNVVFCLAFGPLLVRALERYRDRLEVTWHPLPAASSTTVAVLAVVAALAGAAALGSADARAADPAQTRGLSYLAGAQNSDGGFGADRGRGSDPLYTSWAVMGIAAAGRDPRRVRRGGRSGVDYVVRNIARFKGIADVERAILALRAGRRSARSVGGRDLVAELIRSRRRDGSFAGLVNQTAFAILALRAAGRPASDRTIRAAAGWVAGQHNDDGGFNFAGKGGPSGIDDTAAAVQGLVAAGKRSTRTVSRAAGFIAARQKADGGMPLSPGGASNAQSTSWAIQAFVAAGRDPNRVRRGGGRSPLAYLRSLQGSSGAIRYSRTSTQSPVWVTAQALTALARRPFPIR
jgi:energy-coupling factor transport system substrate-specific component